MFLFLFSAELKEWTLVIMGTKEHPQAQNITPPAKPMQPFTCNGINEHGVCIGQFYITLWYFFFHITALLFNVSEL